MDIETAVALIRTKYEENREREWIRDPVAFTLYEVWKMADDMNRTPKDRKENRT